MICTKEIPSILKEIEEYMIVEGYSLKSVNKISKEIKRFYEYLHAVCIDIADINTFDDYLNGRGIVNFRPSNRNERDYTRPLFILIDYSQNKKIERTYFNVPVQTKIKFQNILDEYHYDLNKKHFSECFKQKKLDIFENFLDYIDSKGLDSIHSITKEICYSFITDIKFTSISVKKDTTYRLRDALSWLYSKTYISFSGKDAFPILVSLHDTKIPRFYTADEIQTLLNGIDTSAPVGKCYYAMISLLVFYGLRKSDVLNLKLSDIQWENDSISLIQKKTKVGITLPLIDEIKYPLIDYLKNARPSTDSNYIFIRQLRPYRRYSQADFNNFIKSTLKKEHIDIDGRSTGCHIFRFSLANSLLNDEIQMPIISNVLGHSTMESTNVYLAIDTKKLRKLALEVPYVSK